MTNEVIGELLSLQRKAMGMTQWGAAEIIDVSQSAFCRIENGQQTLTLKDAVKLEEHLGEDWFRQDISFWRDDEKEEDT